MPITLDPEKAEVVDRYHLHKGHRRGLFEPLHLTPKQKSTVIYRKMESMNSEISDTFHPPDMVWVEEFTGMPQSLKQAGLNPRVFVVHDSDIKSPENLRADDGLILTFEGKCAGPRSMDDRGRVISMGQADEIQELGDGEEPAVWNLWEFRLASLVRTDGPARAENLADTAEDKQNKSETRLVDMITNAFSAVGAQAQQAPLNINTMMQDPKAATDSMVRQLAEMSPDRRQAIMDMAESEGDGQAEKLVNKNTAGDTSFKTE